MITINATAALITVYITIGCYISTSIRRFIGWRRLSYYEDLQLTFIVGVWPFALILLAGIWVYVHAEKFINKLKAQHKESNQ